MDLSRISFSDGMLDVRAEVSMIPETYTVTMGEKFEIKVTINWKGTASDVVVSDVKIPMNESIRLINRTVENLAMGGVETRSGQIYHFDYEALKKSHVVIPEIAIHYQVKEGMPTTITAGSLKLRIKGGWYDLDWKTWAGAVALLGFSIIVLSVIVYFKRRKSQLIEIPIQIDWQEKLNEIKRIRLSGDSKKFFSGMENLAISFMKGQDSAQEEIKNSLNSIILKCREVRYSPVEPPPHEVDKMLRDMEKWITQTK